MEEGEREERSQKADFRESPTYGMAESVKKQNRRDKSKDINALGEPQYYCDGPKDKTWRCCNAQ